MPVSLDHAAPSFPKPAVLGCRKNEVKGGIAANPERSGRCGLHCGPQAHRPIGTFPPLGTVRASVGLFNAPEDVEALVMAIREITRMQDSLCP